MRKIPFLRLCIILIVGIFCNPYFEGGMEWKFLSIFLMLIVISIFYFSARNHLSSILPYGFSLLLFTFCLGLFAAEVHLIENSKSHYSNCISKLDQEYIVRGSISQKSRKTRQFQYDLQVENIQTTDSTSFGVTGLVQVLSKIDIGIGDEISVQGGLQAYNEITNQYTFDYKAFQKRKYKIHQMYEPEILEIQEKGSWIGSLRDRAKRKMESLTLSESSNSILHAMILGDKSKIREIERTFRSTGTSHVLAISGLHIGIVAAILSFLLSFFKGKWIWIKYIFIMIGSWIFCLISGAAPSTIRACIMVTCFFTSKLINEKANGFNFCFIAAFFMLIQDPNKIYDIGFQFSFLAILGILLFYEPFYKVIICRGFYDKIWQMTAVTIAAQMALTPLSLYYFHEFPMLFIPASLIAIPITFVIISFAVLVLSVNFIMVEPIWLTHILNWLVETFVNFLNILANIPGMVIQDLNPSFSEVILYYIIMAGIVAYYHFQMKRGSILFLFSFILLLLIQLPLNNRYLDKQIVIYAHHKNIHFDVISSGAAYCFDEKYSSRTKAEWFREPYHLAYNVRHSEYGEIELNQNVEFEILDRRILILNEDIDVDKAYDIILINTSLELVDCFPENAVIVDFGKNKTLRKEQSNILFNHQIIISK